MDGLRNEAERKSDSFDGKRRRRRRRRRRRITKQTKHNNI